MWWFLFGIPMLGRQKWACPWPQWPDSLDCLVDLCWLSSVWVFVCACACVGVPAPIRVEARGWCLAFSCIAVGFVLSNRNSHWTWSLALLCRVTWLVTIWGPRGSALSEVFHQALWVGFSQVLMLVGQALYWVFYVGLFIYEKLTWKPDVYLINFFLP